jgi:hypothetical protein
MFVIQAKSLASVSLANSKFMEKEATFQSIHFGGSLGNFLAS